MALRQGMAAGSQVAAFLAGFTSGICSMIATSAWHREVRHGCQEGWNRAGMLMWRRAPLLALLLTYLSAPSLLLP